MNSLNFNTMLEDITFSIVDTETTGISFEQGAMIEIACVCIRPGLNLDMTNVFESLIYTDLPITEGAYSVHNISSDMLKSAPKLDIVMSSFADFVNGSVLVAHNARFDMSYINKAYKECCIKNNISHVFDSVAIARKLLPNLESHNLDSLINYYNVSVSRPGRRHRALFDTDNTAVIFLYMLQSLVDMGIYTLGDLYQFVS